MDIVIVLDEAISDRCFECVLENDGSKKFQQGVRSFLIILAYWRRGQAETVLEELRRKINERRTTQIVNLVADQEPRAVEPLYRSAEIAAT